jgi:Raf kinase inhibitor-like YbhB/YbcL family protein
VRTSRLAPAAAVALAAALTACGASRQTTTTAARSTRPPPGVTPGQRLASGFSLTSPAFHPGAAIPRQYTCDGADISPPLRFSGVPRTARELVLVVRDPDAPGGNFVHWALAGIAPTTAALPQSGVAGHVVPGRNSFGSLGYRGPCPPRGSRPHHYVLTLSALSSASGLHPGFTPDQLQTAALGIATLIGTYARQ